MQTDQPAAPTEAKLAKTTHFALTVDGREVKRHSTRLACEIEAIERGLAISGGADFPHDRDGKTLRPGVSIIEVEEKTE